MSDVFSADSLDFLRDIQQNNSREWYLRNKPAYEKHLLRPFKRLVSELSASMLEIDFALETTPAVDRTISRIYRDTRFSHDKSKYRANMWLIFKRGEKGGHPCPAFFFEIYPAFYHYGMGFYNTSASYMELYRRRILEDEEAFLKIISPIAVHGLFTLDGELYKRNRYPGKSPQVAPWYNRRNLFVLAARDDIREIYNFRQLRERLAAGYASLSALYRFLLNLVYAL